jgi:hypothetical protein
MTQLEVDFRNFARAPELGLQCREYNDFNGHHLGGGSSVLVNDDIRCEDYVALAMNEYRTLMKG